MKKRVWFCLFTKVVPADFEAYMERQAAAGWQVDHIGQFSSFLMTFQKTAPKQYRYVFDLNAFPTPEYRDTYQAFGWEYVGKMASCYVWRQEYAGERPESFADRESLQRRNRRVRNAVLICLILCSLGLLGMTAALLLTYRLRDGWRVLEDLLSMVPLGGLVAYLSWVVWKIQKNLNR